MFSTNRNNNNILVVGSIFFFLVLFILNSCNTVNAEEEGSIGSYNENADTASEYYESQTMGDDDGVCLGEDPDVCYEEPKCGVYMAPSTIGQGNMGIYTGFDIKKGSDVNYPEIAIPILFRDWDNHGDNDDGTLWDRYIWNGEVADIESRKDTHMDPGPIFVPGIGCTVNSIMDMHNIHSTHGSIYDTCGLHRAEDPGVGAFTPYHESKTTARYNIAAGSELFAAYGTEWIPEIDGAIITLNPNLNNADEFLEEYNEFISNHSSKMSDSLKEGLWDYVAHQFNDNVIKSQLLHALPKTSWNDVSKKIEERKTSETRTTTNLVTGVSRSVTRSFIRDSQWKEPSWLQKNGKCQDHIKPGKSLIPQAGYGAFAARFLPKGTVVGYSPLIHVGDNRELFNIEYSYDDKEYEIEDLVINYSFKHKDSTLILTPYGGMVNYINHASPPKANVKVQFPSKELIAHKPKWLKNNVNFFENAHEKIGLSFDYIALRDIKEGEEIYMDYGSEWVEAWEAHVKNYQPIEPSKSNYVHSTHWKENYLRTVDELKTNPYPSNLHTMCFESRTLSSQRKVVSGATIYEWIDVLRPSENRVYCNVIARTKQNATKDSSDDDDHDEYLYTVAYYASTSDGGAGSKQNKREIIVENVPSPVGVELRDKVYHNDWHLPNAFRHTIAIPDDIMPEAWKNNKLHDDDDNEEDDEEEDEEEDE